MRCIFGSTKPGKTQCILEVLNPEKTVHFGSTVPGKNGAFWKYCSRKKQRILEVLFPEKTLPRVKKSSAIWKYCSRKNVAASQKGASSPKVAASQKVAVSLKVKLILEVLFPEKCALSAGELAQFQLF